MQIEDVYVPIPQRRKAPAVIRIAVFHTRKLRRRQKYMASQPKVQATVSK